MLIDSHCHLDRLDLEPYGNDFHNYMRTAREAGLGGMLCVSISWEAWPAMAELVKPYPEVLLSVGVHPNETEGHDPDIDELVARAGEDPRVVAIGETGLDYFRTEAGLDWQHERFHRHIEASRKTGKPLIIHTRNAREDTLKTLEERACREAGGVMHCFAEDWEAAKRALDMGYYISFSGIVTFKSAREIMEVAQKMPLERMLIETDSPYLAPVPNRGKPNYPHYVQHVAAHIADLRGLSVEAIEQQTAENFRRLFRLESAF